MASLDRGSGPPTSDQRGDRHAAEQLWRAALALAPGNPNTRYNLAIWLTKQDRGPVGEHAALALMRGDDPPRRTQITPLIGPLPPPWSASASVHAPLASPAQHAQSPSPWQNHAWPAALHPPRSHFLCRLCPGHPAAFATAQAQHLQSGTLLRQLEDRERAGWHCGVGPDLAAQLVAASEDPEALHLCGIEVMSTGIALALHCIASHCIALHRIALALHRIASLPHYLIVHCALCPIELPQTLTLCPHAESRRCQASTAKFLLPAETALLKATGLRPDFAPAWRDLSVVVRLPPAEHPPHLDLSPLHLQREIEGQLPLCSHFGALSPRSRCPNGWYAVRHRGRLGRMLWRAPACMTI